MVSVSPDVDREGYAGHVAKIEIESLLDVAADRRAGIARVVRDELHRRGG
jgi:hypothetical protein